MSDTERRLAAVLIDWWASQCDDPSDAEFVRTALDALEAGREYAATLLPVVAEIEAEARAAERERVAAAIEAAAVGKNATTRAHHACAARIAQAAEVTNA